MVERRALYSTSRITRTKFVASWASSATRSPTGLAWTNVSALSRSSVSPSTSQARTYSASSDATEDTERPGLFYHPVGNNVFALSFLSEKPTSPNSATVIGLIPEDQGLDAFEENRQCSTMSNQG